jgi:signal transduction histidine kinase
VMRVDRLLTHTVSLAGLTSLVVGVYLLVVIGLGRSPRDDERGLLLLSMAAAAIAAAIYLPARIRLEEFANRLVYGERISPDEALRTFGTRMTRAIPLDELLLQLAESLKKSLPLEEVEIWTGSDGLYERVVSLPHRDVVLMSVGEKERPVVARAGVTGGTWLEIWLKDVVQDRDVTRMRVASLAHAGELLGLIVLMRRAGTDPFTEEQDDILGELARQVGLALHNVQLDSALQASLEEVQRKAEELQESRLRIVTAGDAERRRLERDLHDGAQQQLVALSVKVNLARTLLESDPAIAMQMLDELKTDVTDAVQELRNLAHGIFPPLLMSGGLGSALPAAATRCVLPATVDIEGVGRYPQAVESTVYFCCLEAMQNASKHAGDGSSLVVRAWEDDGGRVLCFEVADDGAGFDLGNGAVRGHGFVNMEDRLGALGGELVIWSEPGKGARVGGRIPLTDDLLQP